MAKSRGRRWILLALFAGTLLFGALQLPSLGDMSDRGVGIVELELSRTSEAAARHYDELGEAGRDAARTSLYLDYPYLVFYGLFFAAACLVVAERAAERGMPRLARPGRPLAVGALVGAACDAVENVALLRVLAGHTAEPWPGIAYGFAAAKFALTFAAAVYAIVGFVITATRGPARTPPPAVPG
ncbi:MAG TPA: hypothetical protein VJT75_16580 [Thermoleophilaceae bacterium]|nr:hypothetical protein [Thermoleophilaceae bacterium]